MTRREAIVTLASAIPSSVSVRRSLAGLIDPQRAKMIRDRRSLPAVSLPGSHPIPAQFKDIARTSGVDFILNNCATPNKYQIEPMVAGIAIFDYNNDGWLDLYFANGAHIPELRKTGPEYYNRLYRNNGDGTFTDVTERAAVKGEGYSMGVAAGDYDNDGWEDLFVVGVNQNTLFHNNGDGTFSDVTAKAGLSGVGPGGYKPWSICAGWFDYDNDGWLDLFVVNYCDWAVNKDPYCGVLGERSYCSPSKFAPLPNMLYHNNRDGTFSNVSRTSGIGKLLGKGMGVAFSDYDDDGYTDIFVANDTTRNFLFHNNGDGTFSEVGLELGVAFNGSGASLSFMGVDFRDVDNDGRPDLFVTALSNETFTYFHNLDGRLFEDWTQPSNLGRLSILRSGWSNGIYDLNNDGWKDLVAVNSHVDDNIAAEMNLPYKQPNSLFLNTGRTFVDGTTEAGEDFQAAAAHRGCAFGDLNNDGKVDLVVSVLNGPAQVLRNVSTAANHWLMVKTVGTRSNRDGIGAKLRLESASGIQHNHVTTSAGYAGSSDPRVHFGLGKETFVNTLEIRWPSGARQELHDIMADQILKVVEPRR
ncbi:MAG: CRTAC1 family protein [Terriglobia bacterium]